MKYFPTLRRQRQCKFHKPVTEIASRNYLILPLTVRVSKTILSGSPIKFIIYIGQSHHFWIAYSLFVALVALFAPKRSEGANDATRNTKLYALQKSCDSHYYQYAKPNRRHLFHKERLFNMKSCCGLQIPFTTRTLPFGRRKGAFQRGQFVIWSRAVIIIYVIDQASGEVGSLLSYFLFIYAPRRRGQSFSCGINTVNPQSSINQNKIREKNFNDSNFYLIIRFKRSHTHIQKLLTKIN